jgi:hypothetical protein
MVVLPIRAFAIQLIKRYPPQSPIEPDFDEIIVVNVAPLVNDLIVEIR